LVVRGGGLVATASGTALTQGRVGLAVGDWVAVRHEDSATIVVGVAERWSELKRLDPTGLRQILAANVDVVFIAAPADRLSLNRVEREVVLAWESGAKPVVLVTKLDVAGPALVDALRERLVGTEVVATSVVTGQGLDEIASILQPAQTAVLLGPSGAGKSSLVNALLGEHRTATSAVRLSDQRGRHTTSVRELFVVPTGGCLIDSPGLRSVSLTADRGSIAAAFADIAALADSCRFRNCRHVQEPGCAVLAAAAAGTLDLDRLGNYLKLNGELDVESGRDDPAARAAQARLSKTRAKTPRQSRDRGPREP
jgi:ribosome biogenesis GTPase / thiamine phosphate phosphatase